MMFISQILSSTCACCSMVLYLLCFLALFSCRYLAFQFSFPPTDTCTFVFCIWGFAFVAFLLSLVAYVCFLVELFVFCHPGRPWVNLAFWFLIGLINLHSTSLAHFLSVGFRVSVYSTIPEWVSFCMCIKEFGYRLDNYGI